MVTDDIRQRILAYIREQAPKPREELVELVAASQQQYMAVIAGLSDGVASKSPLAGEWSLRELNRHVILAQDSGARIIESLGRGETLPGDALGAAGSMLDDDSRAFGAYVTQLGAANARMIDASRSLPASPDLTAMARHPWLGPLNCLEWAANQHVHEADHVQHARKILAAVG
jgi:DinB family protein